MKALILPLSMYGLTMLMIPACTVLDNSPGNLCRYTLLYHAFYLRDLPETTHIALTEQLLQLI